MMQSLFTGGCVSPQLPEPYEHHRGPRPGVRQNLRTAGVAILLTAGLFSSLASAQLYRSSVTATDYDFIVDSDPDAFLCLEFKGKGHREMPDKRGGAPLIQKAFIFVAYFSDGTQVDIAIAEGFSEKSKAETEALRYTPRLGRLPTALRRGVKRLVVHKGAPNTTAFSDHGLIVMYSDNATRRISTHDLEETIFHESVHAAWDSKHANSEAWKRAQSQDGVFATRYAKNNPRGEDLAESALFAYTLIHHPGRLPAASATKIQAAIPARIEFVRGLIPAEKPLFFQVAPPYACDGSGKTFIVSGARGGQLQEAETEEAPSEVGCTIDLSVVPQLSDVVSNALTTGLGFPYSKVTPFLAEAKLRFEHADGFLRATAKHFKLEPALLKGEVELFRHCNCEHGASAVYPPLAESTPLLKPELPAAPSTKETWPATSPGRESEDSELKPLLYAVAILLGLLLLVNLFSLRLLIRQSKA